MKSLAQTLILLVSVCSLHISAQNDTTTTKRRAKNAIGFGCHAFPNSVSLSSNPHISGYYYFDHYFIPQIYYKRNFCFRANKVFAVQMNLDYRSGRSSYSSGGLAGSTSEVDNFKYWNIQFALLRHRYVGKKQNAYVGTGIMYNQHFLVQGTLVNYTYDYYQSYRRPDKVYSHYFASGNVGVQLALGKQLHLYKNLNLHIEASTQLRTPQRKGTGPDITLNLLTGLSF